MFRLERSQAELERSAALMWLLFLPQALLRQARRGGAKGRGEVAQRFACVSRGDWGGLVLCWKQDVAKQKAFGRSREERNLASRAEQDFKLGQTVVGLVSKGLVSKAMGRLSSFGVADMSSDAVRAQVLAKHPACKADFLERQVRPESPVQAFNADALREVLLGLRRHVAGGCGSLRNQALSVCGELWSEEEMASFCRFGEQYVSGNLPSWFVEVWLSVECVGLFKTAQQEVGEAEADRPIRPIGMRDALVKCFHREVFRQNRSEVDMPAEDRMQSENGLLNCCAVAVGVSNKNFTQKFA